MKNDADNFKESAILSILEKLKEKKISIIIYEPLIFKSSFRKCKCYSNFRKFISDCDLIIANRIDKKLKNVQHKVYSRDIFMNN